ncbi:MAG: Bax inhibitor-1/YccA family protein [Flavobacteriales bacterium]|nr:Bax inhibitor-1/YccA family protein [Flavobacteriales bacterium]
MNDQLNEYETHGQISYELDEKVLAKDFMSQVFGFMSAALAISGIAAWAFGASAKLMSYLYNPLTGMTMLGWVTMLAPLGFVIVMGVRYHKLSLSALATSFLLFALINGISLSFIFLVYTDASIVATFFITAGTFATMAVLGWRTRTDLTKFGSMLYMALIGIIIAMVVNYFFLKSGTMDYVISFIGVLIFTGLTAYDVQKLKRIGASVQFGTELASKAAVMGALSLYLDFINLFLFLLRFLGSRD